MCRVLAKKIVAQLIFLLSRSLFFVTDLEQNFHPPSFATPRIQGYQASRLQDVGHKCLKQEF